MTVSATQLRAEVNASTTTLPDAAADGLIAVAAALVDRYIIGDADPVETPPTGVGGVVPTAVYDRAVLLVAAEEFAQSEAPNGIVNQAFADGLGESSSTPIRISRDPMKPALPILAPWVSGRFFVA